MKSFILFVTTFLLFSFSNSDYSIQAPKDWEENPNMFGSDVMLVEKISSTRSPISLYIKTLSKKITDKEALKFIKDDFLRNAKEEKFTEPKILKTKKIQLDKKMTFHYLEARFGNSEGIQKSLIGIIPNKDKFHYFYLESSEKYFNESKKAALKSIKKITFKKNQNSSK